MVCKSCAWTTIDPMIFPFSLTVGIAFRASFPIFGSSGICPSASTVTSVWSAQRTGRKSGRQQVRNTRIESPLILSLGAYLYQVPMLTKETGTATNSAITGRRPSFRHQGDSCQSNPNPSRPRGPQQTNPKTARQLAPSKKTGMRRQGGLHSYGPPLQGQQQPILRKPPSHRRVPLLHFLHASTTFRWPKTIRLTKPNSTSASMR